VIQYRLKPCVDGAVWTAWRFHARTTLPVYAANLQAALQEDKETFTDSDVETRVVVQKYSFRA
jgi:hypothetical protein